MQAQKICAMSDSDSIYSSRTALSIITHMWSLPNSDPPIWEFHCLHQCLLGSLQLFDQPEDQLMLIEEFSDNNSTTSLEFGSEEVLHFMRLISDMQKTSPAYPILIEETTDDFELMFHHFGLPIPSAVKMTECRDMCTEVHPTKTITRNEAMMAWFSVLKRRQFHKGSKQTLDRVWYIFLTLWETWYCRINHARSILTPTGDAAIPFEMLLMGVYYLLRKSKTISFLLPHRLPEDYYNTFKTTIQRLFAGLDQFNTTRNRNEPKSSASVPLSKTMIDSRFMKFGETLVDRIADELLQAGLVRRAPLSLKRGLKTPKENNFHMAIRETMNVLLKWDPDDIDSEIPTSATSQQVEDCQAGKISGPRKDNFVLHWEKIGCKWNKRAAKIFADHFAFIQSENLTKAFMDKLHYLSDKRDTLTIQRKGTTEMKGILEEETSVIAKRNRRRSCKVSKYRLRKAVLPRFRASNDYEAWTQMLTLLEADGMSSDETDEEAPSRGSGKPCKVLRIQKPWRNKEIDSLLTLMDHASLEPNMLGRKTRGQQRRWQRTGDHPTKINRELPSLKYPRNFYDTDWILENKPGVVDILAANWGAPLRLPVLST